MIWQDVVIMVSCFGFAVALVPSILGRQKPERSSCVLTILLLAAIAVCFGTLGLWLSMGAELVSIAAWAILLVQRRRA